MVGNPNPDVIVVGGGSAGCAMAGRLAEHGGLTVLLIEAGGSARDVNTRVPAMVAKLVMNAKYDWMLPVEPDPSVKERADFWPAGKWLGGGSAINGMMYIRGSAHDYDHWSELGASGWAYRDVLPYFRRMETNQRAGDDVHGRSGPMHVSESRLRYPITDAWVESAVNAGIPRCDDLNGDGYRAEGVDYVQVSQRDGGRWSAADGYLRKRDHGGRLEILCERTVARVVIENGQAVGVEVVGKDGSRSTVRANHGVVLSAGTLATPKLLMLSGLGPAGHLRDVGVDVVRDMPGVGANLQDHVGLNIAWQVTGRSLNSDLRGLGAVKAGFDYLVGQRGVLSTAIAHAQAMIRTRENLPTPNIQLAFSPFAFEIGEGGQRSLPKMSSVSMLVCALHPKSRGTVQLRSGDPAASPMIRHALLGDADDVEQIAEGIEAGRRILQSAPIAASVVAETRPGPAVTGDGLRDFIRTTAMSAFHQVGTCRMGNDDLAVVDPALAVRGIDRLWVSDCSVMPSLVGANTNATAIMIGEKGSDHVIAALERRGVLATTRREPVAA